MNTDGSAIQSCDAETAAQFDGPPLRHASPFRPFSQGIGLRLLTLIVLFSSLVTLLSTLGQLYFDYRRDVQDIQGRLGEIERSHLGSLAGSLWHVDADQLRVQLEGMLRLPDMQALEIRETGTSGGHPLAVSVGGRGTGAIIARTYPIVYDDRGTRRTIGMLYAEASLDGVYRRLIDRGLVILVSQGVKTFLVSLFILYIVHRLVTRHLVAIADFLGRYRLHRADSLVLHRQAPAQPDELDRMVAAFNDTRGKLEEAYLELRQANEALARDNKARREAEAQVSMLNAQLEQRVRQRTAELEAANAELAAFGYSVSHDLRAPLRRIEGFSQMLAEFYGEHLDDKGHHYLTRIRAGTCEMAEMIDSFLKLSRSTRGELTVDRLDLSAMANDIVARLAEKDPERRVDLDIQPGITMEGDRRLMTAALTNLFENAWKYTRKTERPRIAFSMADEGGRAVYRVADNGAGFDMALVDRLFTPFNRLHKAEEFEGIGIGLATVQRIIARHGGRVWAKGAPGQGATFHFTCWEGSITGEQQPDDSAGRGQS